MSGRDNKLFFTEKVIITECSHPNSWYAQKVGQTFTVYAGAFLFDGRLVYLTFVGSHFEHIEADKCKVVEGSQKPRAHDDADVEKSLER